ncbi:MAG: hypothetical protein QOC96_1020 [Acidobacteriota bacterium]|jgi:hypothetical protein|nr:hypothetical protein [Acidobacteriota bacterium]
MFFKHLVCTLALVLLIQTSPAAQITATQEPLKPEDNAARQALEKKALALLDVVLTDSESLKPMNRLRLQITAANLLWPHDEKRARKLFEKSIGDFNELVSSIDPSDPNFYNNIQAPTQLYNEILQTLAQQDPQMALDFLHQTHLPRQPQNASKFVEPSYELQMETQLVNQIAAKDPKLALQTGLEILDKGLTSNLPTLLQQLQEKDHDAAAKFASALIKKLQSENLLINNEAASAAINLLRIVHTEQSHTVSGNGKPLAASNTTPILDAQTYRELIDLALNAALTAPAPSNPSEWQERNIAQTLIMGLKEMMSDVEQYAPSRVAALQRKIADFSQNIDAGSRFWQDNQEVFEKGSVDDILALASKVSPDVRDQVYQQAAWKAINQGGSDRARQIISDNISNPINRRQMLDQIERQIASKDADAGKLEQARLVLARLRTNEDRAGMLIQLANTVASKGDKKTALQLLDEARSLFSNRPENYNQLQLQLQIAQGFSSLDPARSFEILEPLVAQFNEMLSAAEVLNGFDQQFFRDGELIWQGTNLSNMLSQLNNDLSSLAHADFDRARDVAGRFQRLEVRLMAQLSIARQVLSNQLRGRIPVQGIGAYPFSITVVN